MVITIGPERTKQFNTGWNREVQVDGTTYHVNMERGRSVRMAFASRRQRGYKWYGSVYRDGKRLWVGEVTKSTGARWMLEAAGVVPLRPSEMAKLHADAIREDAWRTYQAIQDELQRWGPKPVWEVQLAYINRRGGYR